MRCVRCGRDCRLKERPDRRCPGCGGTFAFEPRAGDPFTDLAFRSAIDAVSSMGTVRFLPDHLYYELARRRRSKGYGRIALFATGGIALAVGLPLLPVAGIVAGAVLAGLGVLASPSARLRFGRPDFERMWTRWLEVHGTPPALIVRRTGDGPYRGHVEHSDLEQYSFDRAVICDRAATVDVLLANNFHFENNCAVLSIDGYPRHAFEPVRAMLRRNPRLTVYALHDASAEGCALAHRLATDPGWFRGAARVVEVGLRPAHARKLRGVWSDATGPVPQRAPLTRRERAWLASYSLELAAIRPEQVIKRLFAAIVSKTERKPATTYAHGSTSSGGGDGDFYVDESAMADDASAADGGDDAFG